MAITRIQNAYYVAESLGEAIAFYRDALGLKLKFQDGERWAQFDVGGANFALSSREEAAGGAQGAVLVFETDDLDAARTSLRKPAAELKARATWARMGAR